MWDEHGWLQVQPRHLLESEDRLILELWRAWRRDGFSGGIGHLPFAGGAAEQPAALMAAFEACTAADWRIRKREQPPG